jgi:hypothetical protein
VQKKESETSPPNVTQLLVAWGKGDQQAFDALMPEVQKELHRIALLGCQSFPATDTLSCAASHSLQGQ